MKFTKASRKYWRLIVVLIIGLLFEFLLLWINHRDLSMSSTILWVTGIAFACVVLVSFFMDMEEYLSNKSVYSYLSTVVSGMLLISLSLTQYHHSKRYNAESLIVAKATDIEGEAGQKEHILDLKQNGDYVYTGGGVIRYGQYKKMGLVYQLDKDAPKVFKSNNLKIERVKKSHARHFHLVQTKNGHVLSNSLSFTVEEDNR